MTKICTKCKQEKSLENFHKMKNTTRSRCKSCRNEDLKVWNSSNPEKIRAQKYRHRYGIDLEDYTELLKLQNNSCKICSSKDPGRNGKYFHVDHCHETNSVRGLLCDNCNKGLGHFKDSITNLKKAIEYLK